MRRVTAAILGFSAWLIPLAAAAVDSGASGGGQAFSNQQETLAVNYFVPADGVYPSRTGGGAGIFTLGFVRAFAGNFSPGTSIPAHGALLNIAQHSALFSLFGTYFGGNGRIDFGAPDLGNRVAIHAGGRPGAQSGANLYTLTTSQLPAHSHSLPNGADSNATGGGGSFSNLQAGLDLNYVIAVNGEFPSRNSGGSGQTLLGQVGLFAGNFAPAGWAFTDGQLLSTSENPALFSLLGTTYGGDGRTTFALPDLRDRIVVGAHGNGPWRLGTPSGAAEITLDEMHMPGHDHALPPPHGDSGETGGDAEVSNVQPSLALNYLIATSGLFPSRNGGVPGETLLGELMLFAGNFAPRGWAFADGSLLPISENQALFSLLGTAYGGDGRNNFALPDLRGRAAVSIGIGELRLGDVAGDNNIPLNLASLPSHVHGLPTSIPLPPAVALMAGAIGLLAGCQRRHTKARGAARG